MKSKQACILYEEKQMEINQQQSVYIVKNVQTCAYPTINYLFVYAKNYALAGLFKINPHFGWDQTLHAPAIEEAVVEAIQSKHAS